MIFLLALPVLAALGTLSPVADWLPKAIKPGWIMALISALMCAGWLNLAYQPVIVEQGAALYAWDWVPQYGLRFSFYLDSLALMFSLIISGIGALIFLYTAHYFDDRAEELRFLRLMSLFSGAMLWLVLAGNLISLFMAWELTSITSFLLIGFKGDKYLSARQGAARALIVTGGGGLALLGGLLALGAAGGTYELADLLAQDLSGHPWYIPMSLLIMLGAFTKSAQFPFHFWLPGAMDAPTPASAYLHSATMVKAGVYLLARLHPTLGGGDFWSDALMTVGVATLFYSSVLALRQSDLKALLAFTTTAKLGALVALLGVPNGYGVKAALLGIIAHALYKSALFLSVGTIDHSTGTRQVKELGGLRQVLPITGLVVLISALSMAGFPPLLGFVAKETLLEAFMKYPVHLVLVFVSAVLTAAAAYILILDLFWGPVKGADHFHAPHRALELAPLLLACLTAGLAWWLDPLIKPLITPLIPVKFKLVLFPGFNDVFLLSMAAIALGGVAFYLRGAWRAVPEMSANALSLYDKLIGGAEWVADQVLKTQNGKLRHYLMVILGVAMSILLYGGLAEDLRNLDLRLGSFTLPDLLKIMLLILALGAAWFSIRARSHLNAALALGILGYALGGVFLVEPAPDVALVQFLVETLATVVLVIMISRVNPQHRRAAIEVLKRPTDNLGDLLARGRDVLIAVITGLCMFTFSYVAMENRDNRDSIAAWHMENATPEVGATDVVAAIVTDFRGTDTLVEISVFAISALGLLTLLTLNRGPDPKLDTLEMPIVRSYTATPMTRTVVGFILPLVMLILAAHTLYGGIAPGDGFTAGIVGGLGVALFYTVFGYKEAREYLKRLNPAQIIAGGLTLAFANALLPLVLGDNFMGWTDFIPGFGPADLKFSSTLVFEIAIGITVFGSASLMMEAVAHPVEVPDLRRSQQLAALRLDKED